MEKTDLGFLLESIQSLAFVNPFADKRDEIEGMIISRLGLVKSSKKKIQSLPMSSIKFFIGSTKENKPF